MDILNYLSKSCILIIEDATSRDRVLELLIEAAHNAGKIKDKLRFAEAVAARELIVSTAIGQGVAVPHAKVKSLPQFFVVLGILRHGVDWEALDGIPVRLVFLIGGPDDNQKEYLFILSQIVKLVKNIEKREQLLQCTNPDEALSLVLRQSNP
ncbi:MAG: PTS sugar transporter subunit IIA [Spirochaetales bacterium]